MFCPKCGSILMPKTKNNKRVIECSCGYKEKDFSSFKKITEKVETEESMAVVDKEIDILPETEEECSKCGHNIASYWTVQTRAGDEPETKFLKCKKCKHIWRDYS